MDINIRTISPDEIRTYRDATEMSFGHRASDESIEAAKEVTEPERSLVAEIDGSIVGTAGVFTFQDVTVPGNSVPAAGVTMVGVLPTHRRRGVLTRLMHHQLRDIAARGEPLALLWASEGGIYSRYGYGLASYSSRIDILREHTQFTLPMPKNVRNRFVEKNDAISEMNQVYDAVRAYTPGFYARSETWWRHHRLRDQGPGQEGPPIFTVLVEIEDKLCAYALYRLHHDWSDGFPQGRLEVLEAVADGTDATRALWGFLFGVDLVGHIESWEMGIDPPLGWMLQDARRLRSLISDGLWARIIDLPSALEARRYSRDGSVVIDMTDEVLEGNNGTWKLEVVDGRGTVSASEEAAELTIGIGELSALYLGGMRATVLRDGGRILEHRAGAALLAEQMFFWHQTPWCPEIF